MPLLSKRLLIKPITFLSLLLLLTLSPIGLSLEEDRLKQIDIEADEATFNETQGLTTYSGNVILSQGSLELKAQTMQIYQTSDQQLKDIKANGTLSSPVSMKQQVRSKEGNIEWVKARSNKLIYNMKMNQVKFIGEADIKKGDATIQSDLITYDANNGVFHASNNSGKTSKNKVSKRVRISLPPQTQKSSKASENTNNNSQQANEQAK